MVGSETEDDTIIAARVVAVLLSLASLVESLIHYPRPVRRLILWLMRPCEKAVRNFVLQQAFARNVRVLPQAMFMPPCRNGAAEIRRMALCFRAMSNILAQLASPGEHFARWPGDKAWNYAGPIGGRGRLHQISKFAEKCSGLVPPLNAPTRQKVEAVGQKWNSS